MEEFTPIDPNLKWLLFGLLIAIACRFYNKKLSLFLLFTFSLLFRLFLLTKSAFFYNWDERYHVVVAKNLIRHWLRPTLLEFPVLPYNFQNWYHNHVWLHKQPLFLWQMAISMKAFGVTPLGARLPSAIMCALLVLVVYDIGKKIGDVRAGFWGAVIMAVYEPLTELSGGIVNTDHNDVAFIFYVTLSIWAWISFESEKKPKWFYWAGVFSGMAILCKWLPGLVVFVGYVMARVVEKNIFYRYYVITLFKALAICCIVFVPWQVFSFLQYPSEAAYEHEYNMQHFFSAVEGKSGDWKFYLDLLGSQYQHLQLFIGIGILTAIALNRKNHPVNIGLSVMVLLVYLFFSVSSTKMPAFVLMVSPINVLFIGIGLSFLTDRFIPSQIHGIFVFVVATFVLFAAMNLKEVSFYYFDQNNWMYNHRVYKTNQADFFKKCAAKLNHRSVVVDCKELESIDFMAYTDRPCYDEIDSAQFQILVKNKFDVVFASDSIPNYAQRFKVETLQSLLTRNSSIP